MTSPAPRLRLLEVALYERPVRFRIPFRFGAATVTHAPQAFVRARIRLGDGREADGIAAELMVPKWFDKSPALTHEENFTQLRRALALARTHMLAAEPDTAFGVSAAIEATHHKACAAASLPGLIASFGLALIERAVIDALGRLLEQDVFALVRENVLGVTAATAPDLADFAFPEFLAALRPTDAIAARHTVGLIDALTQADVDPAARLNDGLPETLEEAIAAYGHRYFKLKASGDARADVARLTRIAEVLDALPDYRATLDGNEQFENVDAVVELWRRIGEEPRLERLAGAILFIEQPIARAQALAQPIHRLAELVAVEIDESDAEPGSFVQARALGYRGISAKSCKGFYRALINRARVARWNAEGGSRRDRGNRGNRYFMSAEDLTTQAGVAVQQDLALAALTGATHVERNGHHYVDGMAGAPEEEQLRFLTRHPDLYRRDERRRDGRVRLAIRDGALALGSLVTPGLGVGVMPDWSAMQAMEG
jgi:hypothetical protein